MRVSYDQRNNLEKKLFTWSSLIENHLKKRRILEPSKLGLLSHDKLYESSKGYTTDFFGNAWYKLSNIEKNDFSEASKCLLVQCWTASAMISLRGLEGIIRNYYEFKTKEKHRNRGMYELIEELQKIEDIDDILMGHLHYLRGIRNKAEHPDLVFNQTEAETVFIYVAGAVREIYKEMPS